MCTLIFVISPAFLCGWSFPWFSLGSRLRTWFKVGARGLCRYDAAAAFPDVRHRLIDSLVWCWSGSVGCVSYQERKVFLSSWSRLKAHVSMLRMPRIAKEISSLATSLPLTFGSSVFGRVDEVWPMISTANLGFHCVLCSKIRTYRLTFTFSFYAASLCYCWDCYLLRSLFRSLESQWCVEVPDHRSWGHTIWERMLWIRCTAAP